MFTMLVLMLIVSVWDALLHELFGIQQPTAYYEQQDCQQFVMWDRS